MHFWSHAFVLLHGCAVAKVKVRAMLMRNCECVKQIHITRAMQAMHESINSRSYNKDNLTKYGEFCSAEKDLGLFSCYIKQIMNVVIRAMVQIFSFDVPFNSALPH